MVEALRCLCIPHPIPVWSLLATGGFALLLYVTLCAMARYCTRSTPWKRSLVLRLQLPLLLFIIEATLLFSLWLIGLTSPFSLFLTVTLILTCGGGALIAAKVIFEHLYATLLEKAEHDPTRRTPLTQAVFLYWAVVTFLLLLTCAACLMLFPNIKTLGLGILGSAGVLGVAVGLAARPMILNLLAGFQLALSHVIKIGDRVVVNEQEAHVESIQLTRVILRTWDHRRLLIPISHFIDQPFENWDLKESELISSVFIYCDFTVPVEALRTHFLTQVKNHPAYSGILAEALVTDLTDRSMEIRLTMSTKSAADGFTLRTFIREKMIAFLQERYPSSLPCVRHKTLLS